MSSTFAEAWNLLLSDSSRKLSNQQQLRASVPVTSPTSKPNLRIFPSISSPSVTRFPPLSRPLQTRPSSGGVSESGRQSMSLSTPSPQPTQEDQKRAKTLSRPWKQPTKSQSISVAEGQALAQDSSLDITRLLQSLRHDVNSLQCSGSARDDQDNLAITLLNRKLERLTDAVVSTTSSAPSPAKDGNSSSTDGSSSSSSSKERDQELRCWDSCCGGRKFSNKSNFIRHQRERSGELGKLRCSFCSAYFSRSSARNAHEAKRTCGMTKSNHSY